MHDEFLDLVDEEDRVIGRKLRSEVYREGLNNFRVVNAFLVNSHGAFWVPRRTAHKRLYPSCLDMSMGGHVESGETYDEAFRRELKEELSLDADKAAVKILGKLTPHEHGVSAFMVVYEIATDETPDYNKDDFTESYWLAPSALLQKIAAGDCAKSDLPILVKLFHSEALTR